MSTSAMQGGHNQEKQPQKYTTNPG